MRQWLRIRLRIPRVVAEFGPTQAEPQPVFCRRQASAARDPSCIPQPPSEDLSEGLRWWSSNRQKHLCDFVHWGSVDKRIGDGPQISVSFSQEGQQLPAATVRNRAIVVQAAQKIGGNSRDSSVVD